MIGEKPHPLIDDIELCFKQLSNPDISPELRANIISDLYNYWTCYKEETSAFMFKAFMPDIINTHDIESHINIKDVQKYTKRKLSIHGGNPLVQQQNAMTLQAAEYVESLHLDKERMIIENYENNKKPSIITQ